MEQGKYLEKDGKFTGREESLSIAVFYLVSYREFRILLTG